MNFFRSFFLFFLFVFSYASAGCSVIIPCYWGHFCHLEGLLALYASQTKVPDEVIISLSESHKVPRELIDALKNESYPFNFRLIETRDIKYAGENRNIGVQAARHEILIFQDADDTPHPQRVEIICSYMEGRGSAPLLIHQWTRPENGDSKLHAPEWIPFFYEGDVIPNFEIHTMQEFYNCHFLHFGNIAVKKRIFKRNSWPSTKRGQDRAFCIRLMTIFKRAQIIYAPLLVYNEQYSSLNSETSK